MIGNSHSGSDPFSCVLNPDGRYHNVLRKALDDDYEDNYWPEDALFMERNSRDFVSRNQRINENAGKLCQRLVQSALGEHDVLCEG